MERMGNPHALALGTLVAMTLIAALLPAAAGAQAEGSPPGVKSGYIDAEGGRLYFEEAGAGDCIVLVHDGLLPLEVWDAQFPVLARDHRVVRYDRRGYGKSDRPTAAYANVADLLRVFDQLGIEKAWVMGMSAGGGLSINFTLAHPERVSALVLVGAVVSDFDYTQHYLTRGGRFTREISNDPQAWLDYWASVDPYETAPTSTAARERLRQLMTVYPVDLKGPSFTTPPPPALKRLGEIRVPTLVVVGEHDIPDVHAHAGAISAGIPGAQRVIVNGAGHLVPLEQPEALSAEIARFLREGPFFFVLARDGVAAAVAEFERFRRTNPGESPFDEPRLNVEAYRRLQSGRGDDAIELFKLIVEAFPESWNAYDSLAEGYMTRGDTKLAIANYERSLTLNPDNTGARQRIEEMRRGR